MSRASLGGDKKGRRLGAVRAVDDIGRFEGPASASLVGRDEPQQGNRSGDVRDAAKRHLYRLAREDHRVAGSRSRQGEISIEVGALDLDPAPKVARGRGPVSLAGAEFEVDESRVIWPV